MRVALSARLVELPGELELPLSGFEAPFEGAGGVDVADDARVREFGFDGVTISAWSPVTRTDIAWNFEKFLFDKNGVLVKRYSRYYPTGDIKKDISALL